MTLTTEQLSAVETTKEFRALLKYMRAIAKAEPESVKEKLELEEGLWRYASQKTIKAIVGHIDALEFALAANREAQPVLYASEETLAYAKEGEKSQVTWSEPMGDAVIPLFTVPKAQTSGVVNLPTEFISDEGVMVRLEQVMAALALVGVKYERRGDACRAAMLAAAPEGGNG
ncbi:hypothetical protein [Serratia marcescens]|uniref:hypothetical protein n=1 Tax=Serratia marcescens TaxID=615 RepID=UPI00141C92D7|nr:hypothetical protein [Serratia marcescens]CAB1209012.1 hypothetical protein FB6_0599 [Serratia marcescens]